MNDQKIMKAFYNQKEITQKDIEVMREFQSKILNMIDQQNASSNQNGLGEINKTIQSVESLDQSEKQMKNPNILHGFNHFPIREWVNLKLKNQKNEDDDLQFYLQKESNPQLMDQIEQLDLQIL